MRKTLRAAALVLALCCPVFAGDISNPSVSQPPPPPSMTAEEQIADGEIRAGGDIQNGAADGLVKTMLGVIESVLALL